MYYLPRGTQIKIKGWDFPRYISTVYTERQKLPHVSFSIRLHDLCENDICSQRESFTRHQLYNAEKQGHITHWIFTGEEWPFMCDGDAELCIPREIADAINTKKELLCYLEKIFGVEIERLIID
ncbi:MAG: hypothetical protein HYW78_03795 [Parcubacteria group bacterium]|nr:hypothetical protein [Parcubacteria group bacterium]